jgi:PAS domain S-box-containing protein
MKTYRRLFDESPAPMYIYDDHTFDFLAVNNAALHQYGYTREEFLSMNAKQIRPSHEVEFFTDANRDIRDSYFDFGIWQHTRKKGDSFFVNIYAHSTKFKGRNAKSILAVDIDQKVLAEMAVSEKSSQIVNILESITDGFYALNKNWEVTYFNKAAEKVLNRNREEVIGKNLWDFFPNARQGKFYHEYERALTEKVSVHFEEEYAPLGVWGAMNVYPTKDGIAVYFVDITDQKRIQQKISNDERSLRAVINNTTDIIWSIDRQNNIITANDAYWSRVGPIPYVGTGRINGQECQGDRSLKWQQYLERAFNGEAFKIIWEDKYAGKEVYEEISFNPIHDISDHIIGISCFSRDITTQYLHLRMIEKQNERLKEIAWSQSHEVRAPLSNIMGLVNLFNMENTSDPENAELIKLIGEVSAKLDAVVKKINAKALQIE